MNRLVNINNPRKNEIIKITLTVNELAETLSIGMNSAYILVHREDFPKIKVGKRILIPIKGLDEWLKGNSLAS
jgi:excisionase family DNA binding protein